MIFRWLTERRRRLIEEQPFPEAWEAVLESNVGAWDYLSDDEREHLERLIQVFVDEKHWEGAGGLELTDEIRVTIAADACLLLLGRDHSLFNGVDSIVVYPSTVVAPERERSFFDTSVAPTEHSAALLGEAHLDGPVIISWDAAKRGARNPTDGRNVVIHELAHKIDMLDRRGDGTPPLEDRAAVKRWAEVASESFLHLRERAEKGKKTFLDEYGAKNEAEFFAVATEFFFERSEALRRKEPELYDLLKDFYNQDPAERSRRGS